MPLSRRFLPALGALVGCALLLAAAARGYPERIASLQIASGGPYFPGSRIQLAVRGGAGPFDFFALGPGSITGSQFIASATPSASATTVIAAAPGALALATFRTVPPPRASQPFIAVASYDEGIALHDMRTFKLIGYAAIGGPPADVAVAPDGDILSADTDGDTGVRITREPWTPRWTPRVATGNEVLFDARTGATFISDRDEGGTGSGALTRIDSKGDVRTVATGATAEGLALDGRRGFVYVGNVNDGTVAQVDARTMRVVKKIRALPRTFGIALDARRERLYAVSNLESEMREGPGGVAILDLARRGDPVVARSAAMAFPLGIVRDPVRKRVFVTDESANVVYALNETTLAALRAPLQTCRTPWRPSIVDDRLYVPCARANRVDVFDLRTLHRVRGAPFKTGGFPVAVAAWP